MVGYSTKRPILISILTVMGWIMVIFNFLIAFSPAIKKIGEFYPALYSLVMCLQFIAFVGIWYMKRWGLELFIASFFARDILAVLMGDFSNPGGMFLFSFTLSVLIIIVMLFYYKRMDLNL